MLLLLAAVSIAAVAAVPTARAGDNSDLLSALRGNGRAARPARQIAADSPGIS